MSMKNKYIVILLIATTMLLSACSSDDSGAQTVTAGNEPVGKEVRLVSYISPLLEKEQSPHAMLSVSSAYTPDKTTSMGIYMLLSENLPADWTDPTEEKIIYNNNKWKAYFEVDANTTYTVYGYMPKTGEMSSTLAKSTENAATLTISNIKPVTTEDICIITGVKATDEGLKEGQFSWYWPIGDENYSIYLFMDHLYAAVMFSMKIDEEYANLRTIKVKQMELSTDKGSVKATISLTHNDTGASPVTGVTYTPSGSSYTAEIFSSEEGTALDKKTPLVINSCFAPTLSNNLTLVTTYDVYDSKRNLIRQNCTATNKLPNLEAVRALRVQVNMTVNPTYLYVLSEPDLDNPTIKLKIDN